MDVMNAFPRTMFSESQLGLVRWAMTQLGVPEMPSVQSTKRQRDSVLRWAGNAPMEATSTHSNLYSAASLSHILAHVRVLSASYALNSHQLHAHRK